MEAQQFGKEAINAIFAEAEKMEKIQPGECPPLGGIGVGGEGVFWGGGAVDWLTCDSQLAAVSWSRQQQV